MAEEHPGPKLPTDSPTTSAEEKAFDSHIEQIHTGERVEGHPGYYEKGGLRTYGDGQDHDHEPPVRVPRQMNAPLRVC